MAIRSTSVRWRNRRRLPHDLSLNGDSVADLLRDRGSLTERMKHRCDGTFRVELLSQIKTRPNRDEQQLLGIPAHERVLAREVLLRCNELAWVYAHTVIPLTTLTGQEARLASLGSQPLGAALFADPRLKRDIVEHGWLVPGTRQHQLAGLRDNTIAWGRRSRFILHGKPLLVSEFFLPHWGQCAAQMA